MAFSNSKNKNEYSRLGVTFHRTFALNRPAIQQVISIVSEKRNSSKVSQKEFLENSNMGSIYIEAMPRWARGCGLLDGANKITAFGTYSFKFDPLLEQPSTQWLMHYHLSAPHGPGPIFWYNLINKIFYIHNIFSPESLQETIGNIIWVEENKIFSKRAVQSTGTIFTGTYLKPEGLNKLHLLESTESGRYRVCEPTLAPIWAIALAFVDYWEAQYPGRLGVGLDTLIESDFLKIFFIGKSEFMEVMEAMQEEGYVSIHRTAPPFQIVLLKQDQEGLLKKLYGTNQGT